MYYNRRLNSDIKPFKRVINRVCVYRRFVYIRIRDLGTMIFISVTREVALCALWSLFHVCLETIPDSVLSLRHSYSVHWEGGMVTLLVYSQSVSRSVNQYAIAAVNRSRSRYWTWTTTLPSSRSGDCVSASPSPWIRSRAALPYRRLPTQTPAVTLSTSTRYTPLRTSSFWTPDVLLTAALTSDSCSGNLSTENTKTGSQSLLFTNTAQLYIAISFIYFISLIHQAKGNTTNIP